MLELREVTKSFGDRTAIDRVSFTVPPGSLTGFVGANGAGKTTTMRVILGITRPDGGELTWQGRPVGADLRRRIGYMPEERGLYPRMPVRKQLVYLARLHGLDADRAVARADGLLAELGLSDRSSDPVDALSLGNQQRAQIAAALVHEPELLLLDEPFSGLDPVATDRLSELLAGIAAGGVPVLFSSHQLDLVERLCHRVVILAAGRVVAHGDVEALRAERSGRRLRLVAPDAGRWVGQLPGVHVHRVDSPHDDRGGTDDSVELEAQDPRAVLAEAVRRGPVSSFGPAATSLGELYREAMA